MPIYRVGYLDCKTDTTFLFFFKENLKPKLQQLENIRNCNISDLILEKEIISYSI